MHSGTRFSLEDGEPYRNNWGTFSWRTVTNPAWQSTLLPSVDGRCAIKPRSADNLNVNHRNRLVRKAIENAFKRFDNGERPGGFRSPKHWYVASETGVLYPTKAIWALANEVKTSDFNVADARRHLTQLEYSVVDIRTLRDLQATSLETPKSTPEIRKARQAKLKLASPKAREVLVVSKEYLRNQDVVDEVLDRANGKCEGCGNNAPFKRKKDRTPYLEVHHQVMLSAGGDDTVENAIALCPNCHRKSHFG